MLPQAEQREVGAEDGVRFAKTHGCLYVETSARANVAVDQAFEELVLKILEAPSLLGGTSSAFGLKRRADDAAQRGGCC